MTQHDATSTIVVWELAGPQAHDRAKRREYAARVGGQGEGRAGGAEGAAGRGGTAGGVGVGQTGTDDNDGGSGEPAEPWFDDRSLDEIRCDLALDMLLAGSPVIDPTDQTTGGLGAIRAEVQITLPITTLTGVTGSGAELNGVTPVDPDTARRMAGTARVWDRVMTDPITGVVTAVGPHTPGWQEGGTVFHTLYNTEKWNALPPLYKKAIEVAAQATTTSMLAHYDTKNPEALSRLVAAGVKVSVFPREVIDTMYKASEELYGSLIASNPAFAKIYNSQKDFRDKSYTYHQAADFQYDLMMLQLRRKS